MPTLPPSANGDGDYRGGAVGDSKPGFDYRLNEDDSLRNPYNATVEKEAQQGVEVGYPPGDQQTGGPGDVLGKLVVDPEIAADTEAAEALRANANVKVRKMGKVARSLNAQSVRKVAKRLTLRGQSGNRRGKPPRIPPGMKASKVDADGNQTLIYAVAEGEDESAGEREEASNSSRDSLADDAAETHRYAATADNQFRPSDEQGSTVSPHDETEGSKTKKDTRHSSMIDDAKDIPAEVVAATMEAGRKLMGALDPHNMLQVQRWRRKNKKGGKKKRKSYVKGKVIDGRHELYTLSIAVMLGVRTSIARTNTIIASSDRKKMLVPQDFMAEEKYEFSPKGSANTPPHKLSHTFKFKDYAPVAFAYLRRMFGVNEFDFLLSVCGNANFIEFISNAKSGQFFFYSNDGKYMIKTMTNAESKFLRRILPHYFRHCTQNPNTLITKFLGMYRVKLYHLRRNVKFVIMNSVYFTDKSLQTFYDLKGSEIGRSASPGQDVLKDNDLREKLPEEACSFPPNVRERLRAQIVSDSHFLRRMQIMDYSMLIGVHHIPPAAEADKRGNIAEEGLRIKERQNSHRSHMSHGSDPMNAAAATVKAGDANGFHAEPAVNGHHIGDSMAEEQNHDSKMGAKKGDSTRKLITDIRESTNTVTNFEFAGLLEEEDDCSYLEGSEGYKQYEKANDIQRFQKGIYDDVEVKKEQTIEQIYWPFHRFYDLNGLRRMKPKPCFRCNTNPCHCEEHQKMVKAWKVPDFTPPLSDRKDGGLTMETVGLNTPMTWHGPQGDRQYEGKIFFMGIIDILQQYNGRKRVETTYRKAQSRQGLEPSCVSPNEYAERFVRFFDEYSQRARPKRGGEEEKTEVEVSMHANGKQASSRDVQIQVSSPAPAPPSEGYKRERMERDKDGKPIIPKGRVIIT